MTYLGWDIVGRQSLHKSNSPHVLVQRAAAFTMLVYVLRVFTIYEGATQTNKSIKRTIASVEYYNNLET